MYKAGRNINVREHVNVKTLHFLHAIVMMVISVVCLVGIVFGDKFI